jgi:tripartite-type tricarboxylate transporter receptor subunit TctC
LGQPLIPVIRSGASGTAGTAYVARSNPDGYTLLIGTNAPLMTLPMVQKLPYKPEDFIPIGQLNSSPYIIVTLSTPPWKTLKDFIDDAKKSPGKFKYSSSGLYEPNHILFAALSQMAGIELIHVPMGGGGPALAALLGGHVDIGASFPTVISEHIIAGKVRPLAVTRNERLKFKYAKEIPTLKELGIAHETTMWNTLFVRKGTPAEVVQKLRAALKQIVEDASFKRLIDRMGDEINYMGGEDFENYWKDEMKKVSDVIKFVK